MLIDRIDLCVFLITNKVSLLCEHRLGHLCLVCYPVQTSSIERTADDLQLSAHRVVI